jgi:hypothetical protein
MMQSSVKMNSPATLQLDCAKPTHIVIWTEDSPLASLVNRINDLESKFNTLLATVAASVAAAAAAPAAAAVAAAPSVAAPSVAAPSVAAPSAAAPSATPGLYFPPSLSPHLSGLNVQAAEVDVDVDVELPLEAEQPEELEEIEEQVEEEVEEEEEEVMQNLTEFEWKDKAGVVQTYWRDSDNQVYEKDEDGDLNDTPIGIWNEAKQKLQRYARAA